MVNTLGFYVISPEELTEPKSERFIYNSVINHGIEITRTRNLQSEKKNMYEGLFPSFLIAFRESLEAALIIVIMAVYLRKIRKANLNRYLYLGTCAAIAASVILAAIVQAVYGGLTGIAGEIFEGTASITATVVLTYMIFWMAKNAQKIKGELQQKNRHRDYQGTSIRNCHSSLCGCV